MKSIDFVDKVNIKNINNNIMLLLCVVVVPPTAFSLKSSSHRVVRTSSRITKYTELRNSGYDKNNNFIIIRDEKKIILRVSENKLKNH